MPDDVPVVPRVDDAANTETIKNLKPPDMIADASQFPLYEKRLKRWSRLSSSLSLQTQFDVILSSVPINNPLCEKLEEEIGDSTQAKDKGIEVILDKLREWFGKEEEAKIGINKCLLVSNSEDILQQNNVKSLTKYLYSPSNDKTFTMENSSQHSNVSEVFKVSMSVKDLMQTENGALVIVDTGAPSSMCGLDWFKKLFQSMPKAIRSQLVVENSTTKFEFGGGERRESLCLCHG